ncbi:hypothetical protein [Micromonospora carbonacea]|uniref:hypothetical protein n=1 Tax=Micromonospora carbonacea TaxID=47853 RepID=UPI00114CB73B|nr:hypothetical protein [Micromonospora carbonacea]
MPSDLFVAGAQGRGRRHPERRPSLAVGVEDATVLVGAERDAQLDPFLRDRLQRLFNGALRPVDQGGEQARGGVALAGAVPALVGDLQDEKALQRGE